MQVITALAAVAVSPKAAPPRLLSEIMASAAVEVSLKPTSPGKIPALLTLKLADPAEDESEKLNCPPPPPKLVISPAVALLKKKIPEVNVPLNSEENVCTWPEAFVMPDPVIIRTVPNVEAGTVVMVKALAAELKFSPATSIRPVTKSCVTLEVAKFAVSPGPLGTVFGIQF